MGPRWSCGYRVSGHGCHSHNELEELSDVDQLLALEVGNQHGKSRFRGAQYQVTGNLVGKCSATMRHRDL